MALNVH